MSTLSVINIQGQSAATLPVFQDSTGTEYGRLCRAFVNYNGSGSSIRASFNVSSVTKNGTGDYTINITNAFSDANYVVNLSKQNPAGNNIQDIGVHNYVSGSVQTQAPTSSAFRIMMNVNIVDTAYLMISVFR